MLLQNNIMYYSLLLLSSLLHITTCTVYTVTPDDHYYPNTTCHHCHNLKHYLLNITKYFTSNTQLLFLPGLHHLHSHLTIQNVHNISLIGKTSGKTLKPIIQGNLSIILAFNASKLMISNLIINSSYNCSYKTCPKWTPLIITDCSYVLLYHLQLYQIISELPDFLFALNATNIMGNSTFSHVMCYNGNINLFYNKIQTNSKHHSLTINHCKVKGIYLSMFQDSYKVKFRILNMQARHYKYQYNMGFLKAIALGKNEVLIIDSHFTSNTFSNHLFFFSSTNNGSVQFINCQFMNNSISKLNKITQPVLINLYDHINVQFNNCNFHDSGVKILQR